MANFEKYDEQDFVKPALLYTLQYFQPSLKKKDTSEHYMQTTIIDLTPAKQPDLEKIVSSEIEFVANQISFKAEWFTVNDYLKLWKKYFKKVLDENMEIRRSFEALESDFADNPNEQFSLMIDSLDMLRLMLETSYDQWHRNIMAEFLKSTLPLELYNMYNLSYIEKISVIKSIIASLTRLRGRLYIIRANEKKIKTELKEFEKQLGKLLDILTKTSRSEFTLRFFLRSSNASKLEDLFMTKPLTLNDDTKEKFTEYLDKFSDNLCELTNFLDKRHLNEDMMLLNSSESESFDDFDEKLREIVLKHA